MRLSEPEPMDPIWWVLTGFLVFDAIAFGFVFWPIIRSIYGL
jgi:hypothetical protein